MTKPTALTCRHITSKALERAKLTIAYVLLERDLFRLRGSTAIRHLSDDERRQLARLGHDIGWGRHRMGTTSDGDDSLASLPLRPYGPYGGGFAT